MIKLSIIIPVYNSEKSISHAIESVLCNRSNEFELIIINDGSEDKSKELCLKYQDKDNRVRLFNINNQGVSHARNLGIKNSRGSYIMFLDSDDYFTKYAIDNILDKLNNSFDLIIFSYIKEDKIGNCLKKCIIKDSIFFTSKECYKPLFELIRNEMINPPWNKVYKKVVIEKYSILFPEEYDIGEDLIFNLDYVKHIESASFISDCYIHYTQTSNEGLVSKFRENRLEIRLCIINKIKELLSYWDILNVNYERQINDLVIKDIYGYFLDFNKKSCYLNRKSKVDIISNTLKSLTIVSYLDKENESLLMNTLKIILKTKNTILILSISKILYYYKKFLKR